ncbi:hypothetical protein ACJMK2_011703 [Sinanodonta woodiana]|uniref:Uncharacterized protein n=1 Tax=Sinanodonta woodiana TaxID=1069815 RepID=A0ABD3V5X4_SINWO
MFLGRILGSVQGHIAGIVQGLLMQKGRYITMIHYQNIGENVLRMCMSLPMELDHPHVIAFRTTFYFLANMLDTLCVIATVNNISNVNVFKSSHRSSQDVVQIKRSLFCSSLGNHLVSQSLEQKIPNKEKLIIAQELLLWGSSSDVASGNLKLAAFYLSQSNLDAMEMVLNHVDAKLTHIVVDIGALVLDESTLSQIPMDDLSVVNLVQHSFAFIVYYGPMDIHIVPKVLTFENVPFHGISTNCRSISDTLDSYSCRETQFIPLFSSVSMLSPTRTSDTVIGRLEQHDLDIQTGI